MPIALMCPHCTADFRVKDEHAGRRTNCPKCGQAVTIPGTPPSVSPPPPPVPPPPVVARPVVANRATPIFDEREDSPPPPRRRPPPDDEPDERPHRWRNEEEEDERPRARERRRADDEAPRSNRQRRNEEDEEDIRPRQRRRDDDEEDDRPRAKRKPARRKPNADDADARRKALLIAGGIAVALLFFGGVAVGAVLYFQQMGGGGKPGGGMVEGVNPNLTQANAMKVQSGMTLAEVEAVLGRGRPAKEQDFLDAQNEMKDRDFTESMIFWVPKLNAGQVRTWTNGRSRFMVGFSKPPEQGGTVDGAVLVVVNGNDRFSVNFLDTATGGGYIGNAAPGKDPPPAPAPMPPAPKPPAELPIEEVAYADLLQEFTTDSKEALAKYKGKRVRLTGVVKQVFDGGPLILVSGVAGDTTSQVQVSIDADMKDTLKGVTAGNTVTVIAQVAFFTPTRAKLNILNMNRGSVVK